MEPNKKPIFSLLVLSVLVLVHSVRFLDFVLIMPTVSVEGADLYPAGLQGMKREGKEGEEAKGGEMR
jgi:hypothetical protein